MKTKIFNIEDGTEVEILYSKDFMRLRHLSDRYNIDETRDNEDNNYDDPLTVYIVEQDGTLLPDLHYVAMRLQHSIVTPTPKLQIVDVINNVTTNVEMCGSSNHVIDDVKFIGHRWNNDLTISLELEISTVDLGTISVEKITAMVPIMKKHSSFNIENTASKI